MLLVNETGGVETEDADGRLNGWRDKTRRDATDGCKGRVEGDVLRNGNMYQMQGEHEKFDYDLGFFVFLCKVQV